MYTHITLLPFLPHRGQTLYDLILLILGHDPNTRQSLRIRDGACDICSVHPLIISERLIELVHTCAGQHTLAHTDSWYPAQITHSGSVLPVNRPPHSFCLVGISVMT